MLTSLLTLGLAAVAYALPSIEIVNRAGGASPDPSQVYFQSIVWNGSGCPAGTTSNYTSPDGQTLTLIFDNMVAAIGPGIPATEMRKNCVLNLLLHYPQGFQYSVLDTTYRGYVYLDAGITAKQEALFWFSGDSSQFSCTVSFAGPHEEDYTKEVPVPLTSIVWSPCGTSTSLNIDGSVALHAPAGNTGQGEMTIDSQDENVKFILGLQWRKC